MPLRETFCLFLVALLRKMYAIKQDASPRGSLSDKDFWKLDGKDHCLLDDFLCLLQTTDVFPSHVRFLSHNCVGDLSMQLA